MNEVTPIKIVNGNTLSLKFFFFKLKQENHKEFNKQYTLLRLLMDSKIVINGRKNCEA